MIWILITLAAAVLALMERYWTDFALRALRFKGSLDRTFAEPGEIISWSATVENHSRLPIPFVRLTETFPLEAEIMTDRSSRAEYLNHLITQRSVENRMSLRARRSTIRTVRFKLPRRGAYRFSKFRLAAGDLLGFKESEKSGDWEEIVIIPNCSEQQAAIDALGGFLGDISVRRFILEDPILTLGFRDYTGREPMKSISWIRSAANGTLQVKQYDHTAEHHIVVILNTEDASDEELEECFRLTRSVCEKLEQKKLPYGFCTNGSLHGPMGMIFHMAEGLGNRHLNTILYGMGRGSNTCIHSFRYLTERTLKNRHSNESYIIITPPLSVESAACVKKLEAAVGNSVCVLTAKEEATA